MKDLPDHWMDFRIAHESGKRSLRLRGTDMMAMRELGQWTVVLPAEIIAALAAGCDVALRITLDEVRPGPTTTRVKP